MGKKQPKCNDKNLGKKQPKTATNPESYWAMHPSWMFSRCDNGHERWKVGATEIDFEIFEIYTKQVVDEVRVPIAIK